MINWLIVWKTWSEDRIDTPWPFQLLEHTTEFKKRSTGMLVEHSVIDSLYLSQDIEAIELFESEHVSAVILCTMLQANDPYAALDSIKSLFQDCEIINCIPIQDDMIDIINEQLKKNQR